MRARVGDLLRLTGHDQVHRTGVILAVAHPDGSPPYQVRWLDDGHETLVFPGEDARVEPPTTPRAPGPHRTARRPSGSATG